MAASAYLLLAVALVCANLPFLFERIFFIKRPETTKNFGWRLAELTVLYLLVGLFARFIESRQGVIYGQGWEFYAATYFLFAVFAYPGFVWRYLWKRT
jgi:amino acid transporter